MDINKKINYRDWVITSLLAKGWSKEKIDRFRKEMFDVEELQGWAKVHLSYTPMNGRIKYYNAYIYYSQVVNAKKKLGINYLGQRIGFGENIIFK